MSTSHDPSGSEPEESGKPSFDKQPPPPTSPYDSPPGYEGRFGSPPGYQFQPGPPDPATAPGDPTSGPVPGPVPGMPPLGTWPHRITARLVDWFLVEAVAILILLPFVNFGNQDGWVGSAWLGYVLYLVYEGLMLSRDGQTLGKKLMKVRVAMLIDGSSPTPGAAWTRAATFTVPALICCGALWWPIDGLFGVFDRPYRGCIHDKAAKTVVVTTP